MVYIKQINHKKINDVQLYKCYSRSTLEEEFLRGTTTKHWSCDHGDRCGNCHIPINALPIFMPILWTKTLIFFCNSYCSWKCCKLYAYKQKHRIYKECICNIGFFSRLLSNCYTTHDITQKLHNKGYKYIIRRNWKPVEYMLFKRHFKHSNNLYPVDMDTSIPKMYTIKPRNKSTLLNMVRHV